jgi:hypothetical protein
MKGLMLFTIIKLKHIIAGVTNVTGVENDKVVTENV